MANKFDVGVIFEVFNPIKVDEDVIILEQLENNNIPKAKFKIRLQTLEEKNGNGRYYDRSIGREISEILRPKAQKRSLYMEMDHPMVQGSEPDSMAARRRALTVEMKNCGALLTNIYVSDNEILGEGETLSGFLGPDLFKLLVYDRADIGTSLRMFGKTQINESTGLAHIVRPIRPITYDIVANPSHATAKILDFVTEGKSLLAEGKIMQEDLNLLTEDQELKNQMCIDGLCFPSANEDLYEYLNQLISDTYKNLGPLRFNI
jgi:hypothetical protein